MFSADLMTPRKDAVRDLLFRLTGQADGDTEESRKWRHALMLEIQETEAIDLHYSLADSNVRNLGDPELLVLVNILQEVDLSHLQGLNLSGCFFQSQSALRKLVELLEWSFMPALRWLDLSGHYSLQAEASSALARALKFGKYSSLEHLGLPRCDIETVIGAIDEGQVGQMQYLVFSGMVDSEKSGKSFTALANLLQAEHMPHLRKLVLMSLSVDPSSMAGIIRGFTFQLEHLDISSNSLDDQACTALSEVFQRGDLALLQRLRLYSCSISSQQLTAIFEGFGTSQSRKSLRCLDLSWNRFGDEGAYALARIIQRGHLSSLRRLNLGYCGIGATGIVAILESLGIAGMPHLELLNLLGNRIGEKGAGAVAATVAGMLEMLPSLERVNLIDSRQGNASFFKAFQSAVGQAVVSEQDSKSDFIAGDYGLLKRTKLPLWQGRLSEASNG